MKSGLDIAAKDLGYYKADNQRLHAELRKLTERYNRESLKWWTGKNAGEKMSAEDAAGIAGKNAEIATLEEEVEDLKKMIEKLQASSGGGKGGAGSSLEKAYSEMFFDKNYTSSEYKFTDLDVGADLGKALDIVDDMQAKIAAQKKLPSYQEDPKAKQLVRELRTTVDAIRRLLLRASAGQDPDGARENFGEGEGEVSHW